MAPENNSGFVEFLEIHHFEVLGMAVFVFRGLTRFQHWIHWTKGGGLFSETRERTRLLFYTIVNSESQLVGLLKALGVAPYMVAFACVFLCHSQSFALKEARSDAKRSTAECQAQSCCEGHVPILNVFCKQRERNDVVYPIYPDPNLAEMNV